jgi:hypothetical protein
VSVREAVGGPHDETTAGEPGSAEVDAGPALEQPPVPPASRRPWVAGALGATWALFVGLGLLACLVMAVWALSPTPVGDSGAAWRAVGLTWLGAHQTALTISGLPVTLLPLGAVLPALLLTRRGGGWAARFVPEPSIQELAALLTAAAAVYGAGGAGVAWLSGTPSTSATLRDAFLACAAVAAAGSLWGIARELGLLQRVQDRVPAGAWRTMVAGWTGALALFVVGAALVALSLIVHVGDAYAALTAIDGGFLAVAGLTLANVLTLPTLAIWGAAYAVGPGFSLGQLGSLSLFGGETAPLPALPVLVAIPSSTPAWAPALMAAPIACGVLAGRVRWQGDLPSWPGALVAGLGVGVVVAPFVAVGAALTSGSLGGGVLTDLGPELGPVTGAAVGLVVLGFLGDAAGQTIKLWWELRHEAEPSSVGLDEQEQPLDLGEGGTPAPTSDDGGNTEESAVSQSSQSVAVAGSLTSAVLGVGRAARSRVVWASSAGPGRVNTPTPENSDGESPRGTTESSGNEDGQATVVLARPDARLGEPRAGLPADAQDGHVTVAVPRPATHPAAQLEVDAAAADALFDADQSGEDPGIAGDLRGPASAP